MNVRLFGGKFIYLGDKTSIKQFETKTGISFKYERWCELAMKDS